MWKLVKWVEGFQMPIFPPFFLIQKGKGQMVPHQDVVWGRMYKKTGKGFAMPLCIKTFHFQFNFNSSPIARAKGAWFYSEAGTREYFFPPFSWPH